MYAHRLKQLRQVMQQAHIDAYVVFDADPHLSEYLPAHYQCRAWLSGFTGSAGSLIITADFAGLWTDSRYWVQAETQLAGTGIQLMRWGDGHTPEMVDWVAAHLKAGQRLAYNGQVVALAQAQQWQQMAAHHALHLQQNLDLLDAIWAERPALPQAPVYVHAAPFGVRTVHQNLQAVLSQMQYYKADYHLLSSLDDIAWLFNLRGSDVEYNPVFLAHALISPQKNQLFVDKNKISTEVAAYLAEQNVLVHEYDQLAPVLKQLPPQSRLLVQPSAVTVGVLDAAAQTQLITQPNPSTLLKACKNTTELAHIRQAMEHDGAALCEFFAWFEQRIQQRPLTELEVDEQLTAARAQRPHFVSPSFSTIAAFGPNAAMPHYQATAESYATIQGNGLLLIDSGAQYLGGTTDITRMVAVGQLSPEQKKDCTWVLKGMLALSKAVFPAGVTGQQLDVLARMPLWQQGLDFGHGTGHGVGYFLNVHEGPHSISWRTRVGQSPQPLLPGMISSNEPGMYRANQWGIRIENLMVCVPYTQTEFGEFYTFETLSLCPIDTRCLDLSLLDVAEINQLNAYHAQVLQRLKPHVQGAALAWLEQSTQPISIAQ